MAKVTLKQRKEVEDELLRHIWMFYEYWTKEALKDHEKENNIGSEIVLEALQLQFKLLEKFIEKRRKKLYKQNPHPRRTHHG